MGQMQTDTTIAASADFAANRAVGVVRFDVHRVDGVTRRRQLHEGRVVHAERLEDVMRHVSRELFTRDALHDVAGQRRRIVGIGDDLSRRENTARHMLLQILADGILLTRLLQEEFADAFLEARGVRHDIAQGDGLAVQGHSVRV